MPWQLQLSEVPFFHVKTDLQNRRQKLTKNFTKKDIFYYWFIVKKEAQIIAKQRNKNESLNYISAEFSKIAHPNNKILFDLKNKNNLNLKAIGKYLTFHPSKSIGKINFKATSDKEAQETFLMMCRKTGILPAIEACYVIHAALKEIKRRKNPKENHLIHLCGSGESNVGRMLTYKRNNE